MKRRQFARGLALAGFALSPLAGLAAQRSTQDDGDGEALWRGIEDEVGGRFGVAVLDTGSGRLAGHRLDERFPMCSTFKWVAAALVLRRVDAGEEQLQRRIRFGREVLLSHSPVTEQRVGGDGMTLAELCAATISVSDNAAGNLLLDSFGGPAALTRYVRGLGDSVTRLDRNEPTLNESLPGDPRDTTSPRAMAGLLRTLLLGDALSAASRAQLRRWMEATQTSDRRLRARLPAGWRLASKTGTGPRGSTHDIGVYWPPGARPPLVVAVYQTGSAAPLSALEAAIARVAARVTGT
ncbi:class A beta-lactamase [Hydrocarboniphaga effusa]|uniref:class A beta-lactamase n=1 Tax=Hydrocarboniphaga effusa TaxID=243629 RepID=UPI00398BDD7E